MTRPWRLTLLLLTVLATASLEAQVRAAAGAQAVATGEPEAAAVIGPTGILGLGRRDRIAGFAGIGWEDHGHGAGRVEATWQVVLQPDARRVAAYLGAGVAHRWGRDDQNVVVLLAGLEGRPGARTGWTAEIGVGGGLRVSAGVRWRVRRD